MAPAGGGRLRTVRFDMKTVHIISLFLAPLEAYTQTSMMAKAVAAGAVRFNLIDLRDFGFGPHRKVDDSPYGGGDGLILMVEPLVRAIETARQETPGATTVLLTPRGQLFDQAVAGELAAGGDLILLGGYYSGYDERVVDWVDRRLSIGHYVLTSAALPALVVTDAVVRLLPGVLGGPANATTGSFVADPARVEHPQYTRPAEFRDRSVPPVLVSGNHQEIAAWRRHQQTAVDQSARRPAD